MDFDFVKDSLGLSYLRPIRGGGGGGCICQGQGFSTDQGEIFIKSSDSHTDAEQMFAGERASLQAILDTGMVRCPRPLAVARHPDTGHSVLVTDYLHMRNLSSSNAVLLGQQIARLHLHNGVALAEEEANASHVGAPGKQVAAVRQFGFHVPTCCGRIPQANTWRDDWAEFMTRDKLEPQIAMIERDYGDREVRELWPRLLRRLPDLFRNISVQPALLHGDLHAGNTAETSTEPVVFDPASFYGHHEFELGIAHMFGGLGTKFFKAYHAVIPKEDGSEARHKLYQLFHYLNHWNHFGPGYRSRSLSLMRALVGASQ